MDFQIYLENSNLEILNTADLPSGKKFKSRFIQAGLAGYPQQYGNVLIKKESLDKFVNTLETKPVIINHQEVTANNVNEIEVGRVHNVWFNDEDGWYWCDGVITNQKAIDLIDKGWSVSCSYNVSNYSDKGGTENNIKYDMEFLDGNFTHLAIVKNPRYEGADIVVVNSNLELDNAKNFGGEEGRWITINGVHVFIPDGKQVEDVMREKGWLTDGKKEDKKEEKKDYKKDDNSFQAIIDKFDKKYDVDKNDLGQSWYDRASINEIKTDIKTFEYEVEKNTEYLERIKELPEDKPFFKANGGKKEVIKGIEEQIKYDKEQIEYAKAHLAKKELNELISKKGDKDFAGMPKEKATKERQLEDDITESIDKYGRTKYSKGNKWADVSKNGNYYMAGYGLTHKSGVSWEAEKGITEEQLLHSKGFKTEKGAKKWALEQLKRLTSDNSITSNIASALAEVITESVGE